MDPAVVGVERLREQLTGEIEVLKQRIKSVQGSPDDFIAGLLEDLEGKRGIIAAIIA